MVKKRVPDWLNSSLWSTTPPPPPSHPPPLDSDDAAKSTSVAASPSSSKSAAAESKVRAPVPVPPPSAVRPEPPKVEIRDPLTDHSDNGSTGSPSAEDFSRQAQLLQELSRKVVNMGELRRLASQGVPDGAGIRSTVWKSEIARRLEDTTSCENEESNCETGGVLPRSEITHGEHPLSLGKTSIWNQFFQDTEIIEQIDRDVKRTHPDMNFFSGDTQFAKSNQDALRNILIIFAKLNPGIRYVQGMNEILAPLFYVFRNDPNEEYAAFAEADTFFCFVELLSGFRDHFCQQLDNSVVGIRSTITKLSRLLKEHDEELWRHLEVTTKVNPQFYAFRWITLLLTQEFNFADSLLIWDTLLSDPEGPLETLLRVCCAMLILIRRRLLAGDFTSNLKLLQHYPPTNISHLLYVANKLRSPSAH
ncbi:TBC1 domain family member 13-like isoform X2 [Camellia sinensis]|uniref:TBC1 domain family member 13-like isoform X2 n=1 Tax=Camellia sinensis TaxID=4442 RepID=UPI0010362E0D|nr:TBC1 domain family member 13-like isoform X2 [Camellia sinensis]